MAWTNYHSHNQYCDGDLPIEDHVKKAINKGFLALGISSHSPIFFSGPWSLKAEETEEYFEEIERLKNKYKDKIQVNKSLEVEYIPGRISPKSQEVLDYKLDYILGSVHFVGYFEDGMPWGIDGPFELFEKGLQQLYHGDIKKVVKDYFILTRQMVSEECPEIIGHIDKIKMHGVPYFSEESQWYINEIKETLDLVAKNETIIEVNTRAIYLDDTKEPYPSWWVLKEILERNIPIQLNSDSHHPEELDGAYRTTAKRLLELGFRTMRILLNRKWEDVEFDANGFHKTR